MIGVGISYAYFSYSKTSAVNNKLIAGEIYLEAETKSFTIGNNLKPMTSSEGMTNYTKIV